MKESQVDDVEAIEISEQNAGTDVNKWLLMARQQTGSYLLLKLKFPDCINYDGVKILLFKANWEDVRGQCVIDPHFGQSTNFIYPIARFEPSDVGWELGQRFVEFLNGNTNS